MPNFFLLCTKWQSDFSPYPFLVLLDNNSNYTRVRRNLPKRVHFRTPYMQNPDSCLSVVCRIPVFRRTWLGHSCKSRFWEIPAAWHCIQLHNAPARTPVFIHRPHGTAIRKAFPALCGSRLYLFGIYLAVGGNAPRCCVP